MAFDYTTLVTSQYRNSPKFMEVVEILTESLADSVEFNVDVVSEYDLDTAEGVQLDVIGLWVGADRAVNVPFDNWFSFDIVGKGFDEGVWRGAFDPPGDLLFLDDVHYRRLLRAVIAANHWDGTLWNYHSILEKAMPSGNDIFAVDNFDMTLTIHVTGPALSPLQEALITTGRLARIKPAGVAIAGYVLP